MANRYIHRNAKNFFNKTRSSIKPDQKMLKQRNIIIQPERTLLEKA